MAHYRILPKIIIWAFFCLYGYCLYYDRPQVKTPLGEIRGTYRLSPTRKTFCAFEGIPYAKAPTGNLRFEPPEPVEPWLGIWDANFTITCAQPITPYINITQVDENCLYVNVYVPRQKPNPKANLDVIVHIHGGGFMYGSGHWYTNPQFLMDREIIFVTLNYRLGILGFLSTEDEILPGNMGLKDQVQALKWVQNNIASFGGNPNSVTLTGISAGGSSVHLHYLSNMSKNLFHRGISHSGVALNSFVLQKDALGKSRRLAEGVGCPTTIIKVMVQCLKQRPFQHLLDKMNLFYILPYIPLVPFAPVVEKGPKPFLNETPFTLMSKKQVFDLPWIASNTPHEGLVPVLFDIDLDTINGFWEFLAPYILDYDPVLPEKLWANVTGKIKEFYLKNQLVDNNNFYDFVQIFTDRVFLVDAETAVRLQSKVTKSPVYYYRFNYVGDNNVNETVAHGDDMKYYFGGRNGKLSRKELKMKDLVLDMLISYAKTGKPEIPDVNWEPTKYDELTYLNISGPNDKQVQRNKNLTPRDFWWSLGFSENERLVPDVKKVY